MLNALFFTYLVSKKVAITFIGLHQQFLKVLQKCWQLLLLEQLSLQLLSVEQKHGDMDII